MKPKSYKGTRGEQITTATHLMDLANYGYSVARVGHQGKIVSVHPARWIVNMNFGQVWRMLVDGVLFVYHKPKP